MGAAIRRVGFIGIGNMGWPMAANLVKAGFEVAVCDAVPGRSAQFASEVGGQAAADAAEAAKGADAVVTILPTSKQVAAVAEQNPFPVVYDVGAVASGWKRALALAGGDESLVIPGHDPMLRSRFPALPGSDGEVVALHSEPVG